MNSNTTKIYSEAEMNAAVALMDLSRSAGPSRIRPREAGPIAVVSPVSRPHRDVRPHMSPPSLSSGSTSTVRSTSSPSTLTMMPGVQRSGSGSSSGENDNENEGEEVKLEEEQMHSVLSSSAWAHYPITSTSAPATSAAGPSSNKYTFHPSTYFNPNPNPNPNPTFNSTPRENDKAVIQAANILMMMRRHGEAVARLGARLEAMAVTDPKKQFTRRSSAKPNALLGPIPPLLPPPSQLECLPPRNRQVLKLKCRSREAAAAAASEAGSQPQQQQKQEEEVIVAEQSAPVPAPGLGSTQHQQHQQQQQEFIGQQAVLDQSAPLPAPNTQQQPKKRKRAAPAPKKNDVEVKEEVEEEPQVSRSGRVIKRRKL